MRWIRLLTAIISARFRSSIDVKATSKIKFYVWFTDIDISMMNHAAILTVMEMGRLDFMVRTGIFKLVNRKKWAIPGRALSVQFYRPLKMFQKAELYSKIAYVDEKWVYMEQEIMRKGKLVAFCLIKATIKKDRKTVSTSDFNKELGIDFIDFQKTDLVELQEKLNTEMNAYTIND